MTANTPIPLDAFATELESLDSDAFATLVGETYAATADSIEVDPPRVTVSEGDRRTELLVAAAGERDVPDDAVDAVVVASDSLADLGSELDVDVVTPADLRERLLYAVPSAEANAIADRLLGVPVRSEAYDGAAASNTDESGDEGDGVTDADGDESDGDGPADEAGAAVGAVGSDVTGGDTAPPPTDRTADDSTGDSRTHERPSDAAASDPSGEATATEFAAVGAPSDRRSSRTVLAVVALAALLVAAGVGFAVGTAGIGGLDGVAGVEGDGTTDPSATDSDATGSTNGSDGGSEGSTEGGNTVTVTDGDPTGEAARNTALSPTCDRSALQVVQIQMNALRYNDNATNDGIRTLRAFASPENRELVGSTGEYVELFETPLYAPMLTFDTAQYSVPEIADGAATVEVVTRENESVTGRYEFRLVRVGGGSGDTDSSLGDVDDCWMTDAVAASTE